MSELTVVWFSCGVASAVAAKLTAEKYQNVRIVNFPVIEEDSDNVRFKNDVAAWIGLPIESASNKHFPNNSAVEVWAKRKFMSGPRGAPCTIELKKQACNQWVNEHKPHWHVLGFTADEKHRFERFIKTERENVLPILIEAGITKADCFKIISDAGIQRPRLYDLGYPNANCIGCVKATSPTYWNLVRAKHPEVFDARAKQSREIGSKLVRVNNERIFLDELDPNAKGRPLKNMSFDCGVFCEETPTPEGGEW